MSDLLARRPTRRTVVGLALASVPLMGRPAAGQAAQRSGPVRLVDHALVDNGGPFLGLGVSYFSALWRCKFDRPRLESDLRFLSRQGYNYLRILSMVGWNAHWANREIAPASFVSPDGRRIEVWPDYWQQLRELVDLAYDRYRLRTQITLFADAQLLPKREDRVEHMRRMLSDVVKGRESKILLLEVANEAWQNGFAGAEGIRDVRAFTRYLADRTPVLVATTSNHEDEFREVYADSAADIATWHFSRDRAEDDGWRPVYDCWSLGELPGLPPVSSNEPIGPGSSVAAETDSLRLVMAAAFAYAARLPMYVFHCEAGVRGDARFEETPAIGLCRVARDLLPPDLANWRRHDGRGTDSLLTVFAGGRADRTCQDEPGARDGCVRIAISRKGNRFVCLPIGIRPGGLTLRASASLTFRAFHPATGKETGRWSLSRDGKTTLPQGPGAWVLLGSIGRTSAERAAGAPPVTDLLPMARFP